MGASYVEAQVRRFFEWWGPVSYTLRWPFVILPLIISLGLSVGFLRLQELRVDDPSYVFTPGDSRWRKELKIFSDTWPLNENRFLPGKSFEIKRFVNILIKAKDGGSVLREDILTEIKVLNDWISNNISVSTEDGRFNLTYQDLCLSYDWTCGGNEHIEMLIQRNKVGKVIDLSYPRGGNKDTPVYLGNILGDVTLFEENNTVAAANLTQLVYFLKAEGNLITRYSSDFSYAVERFVLRYYKSNLITLSMAHYQSLQDGLDENAERFAPNFIVSFSVLSVYALICSFCLKKKPKKGIDWIKSKPWLACAGLSTTLMAISSGFGILLVFGVNYNVINTIIPFLITAIGIDDMFIMNACWEASDEKKSVRQRLSQTLSHGGVAVSLTNITDILSFGIGCFTDLPGIQLFCLYACVSVAFCYVYQLTFFCGFLAIMGDAEESKRHCLFLYKTVNGVNIADLDREAKKAFPVHIHKYATPESSQTCLEMSDTSSTGSSEVSSEEGSFTSRETLPVGMVTEKRELSADLYQSAIAQKKQHPQSGHAEPSWVVEFIGKKYGPFLLSNPVRIVALVAFIIYMVGAYYGCVNFREGLNPGNLVTSDHYISKYFEDIKAFWKSGPQLHVAVLNPPDLMFEKSRTTILNALAAFENTEYTMSRNGSMFFLLEYLNYLDDLNVEIDDSERLWHTKLKSWLKYTGGSAQWESDIKFNNSVPFKIDAFRFTIALKHIVEPNDHKLAAKKIREIADAQPLHVEVYHEAFPFADQYLIILPSTIQNVVISLMCMTGVSLLMVPSLPCGIIIFFSIISINIGVFGYMTLWGVNLDAISMVSIIMSIGFAVDLSAHIIYAFVTSKGNSHQRVIGALEALGFPIFQGATSTIAGITILYTVPAYIILVFFKTIWLTMVIGAIHGLVFIPVFMSIFPVEFFRIPKSSQLH